MSTTTTLQILVFALILVAAVAAVAVRAEHDYGDALTKSILYFEGQRSGKLPPTQRVTWRGDSALRDGSDNGVDLTGGYYDAGDNVKFHFPMAFTTTMLAWSVVEFGKFMGPDYQHALEAIRWGTDYFIKATNTPGKIYIQVGDPISDHGCWERPEDMDTLRTSAAADQQHPGSEVSAEIAAALAASSIVFKKNNPKYSSFLLQRAISVFEFADKFRGSYNTDFSRLVCPFYCDYNGYMDELVWGAAWLYKASGTPSYLNYVKENIQQLNDFTDFGWDAKQAGINVLLAKMDASQSSPFISNADELVCSILPESPSRTSATYSYSPGGLLIKSGDSSLQHTTALGFLLLTYARYLGDAGRVVNCGGVTSTPSRLIELVKSQVDYILGENPLKMSYMVGYGDNFPQKIHHRGASSPSIAQHPQHISCGDGFSLYLDSPNPNPNVLVGAIVGGPYPDDTYDDNRRDAAHSEASTYYTAPFVGILAYFKAFPKLFEV